MGFLVLESGHVFAGAWEGGHEACGEVVFNTSHTGYAEMATDPSYFNQILVTTFPMQGNYGVDREVWESKKPWISGFVCVQIQKSQRDRAWLDMLGEWNIPTLSQVDARRLVLHLREKGTTWGALIQDGEHSRLGAHARDLIKKRRDQFDNNDWIPYVCSSPTEDFKGADINGPRVAVMDLGCKQNIIRELLSLSSEVRVFRQTSASAIKHWDPDVIVLSNGPGDPQFAKKSVETVKSLLGWRRIAGICMGHQILGLALGGKTYKLKFGHRGSNHPVKDLRTGEISITSQNHGYALDPYSLPADVVVTHINLYDKTVEGIHCSRQNCLSVQFHPESHPGPREAAFLFREFLYNI